MFDWEALSRNLQAEGSERFLPERTKPEFLSNLHSARRMRFRVDSSQNRITGCVGVIPSLVPAIEEIGVLWVHPNYRGRGISKSLIQKAIRAIPFGTQLFLITGNPAAVSAAEEFGFVTATVDSNHNLNSWVRQVGITGRPGGVPVSVTDPTRADRQCFRRLMIRHALT